MEPLRQSLTIKDRVLQKLLLKVRPASLTSLLKKGLNVQRTVIETSAGRFYVDPVCSSTLLLQRDAYEPGLKVALWSLLQPGGVFVDVGANEGYFSVIASHLVGPTGRVIAVEPQARLRSVLDINFELNNVKNVEVVAVAVSDRAGTATMHLTPDTNTGSTALRQSTAYKTPQQEVETVTLAQLFDKKGIERADVVKMDIEGFEYEAIVGSQELFQNRRIGALALDLHPRALVSRGHAPEEIASFLRGAGYHLALEFEHSDLNGIWIAGEA